MKKILSLIILALASITANAQFYLGGTLGVSGNNDNVLFALSPDGGYKFNEKWAIGATLPIRYINDLGDDNFGIGIFPYGRYTFAKASIVDFFGEYFIGIGSIGDFGMETGLRPGMSINFNDKFSMIVRTTLISYSYYGEESYVSYGINGGAEIGFAVTF